MASVADHYENLLAPIYVWMAGGIDSAMARGRTEVEAVCPRASMVRRAVDLGAGFGMHAIPLADMGYSVLAIDGSDLLLDTMRPLLDARPVQIVRDDLRYFKAHLDVPAALIVCMGDTLTHLPDRPSVDRLLGDVVEVLDRDGTFVITIRDYSTPLVGLQRFIPVRSDSNRILTCFLEYDEDTVTVHDILQERDGSAWQQRIGSYRKLRLAPGWLAANLEARGLRVRIDQAPAGMVQLSARRVP